MLRNVSCDIRLNKFLVFFLFAFASQLFANESDTSTLKEAKTGEHPLVPLLQWAEKQRAKIDKIQDYTAILIKQENIDGVITDKQVLEIKVRHRPLSFYAKYRYPRKQNGQQAVYIEGLNDGKIVALGVGVERSFGVQKLPPDGIIAMRGNKYPITDLGLLNLVDRLLDVGRKDAKFGECEVNYIEDVKVNKRPCTLIQVTHPVPRRTFIFYVARIYVDKENGLPIMYESYSWPPEEGKAPVLIESYTYSDIKLNVGLTDADFEISRDGISQERAEADQTLAKTPKQTTSEQ